MLFHTKSLPSGKDVTRMTYSEAVFSLDKLDLYLCFIKLTAKKVYSHTHVVPDMLRSFPVTDVSTRNRSPLYSHPR